MAELPDLTLAFLRRHPAAAARTLEALEPSEAATLLERLPVRIAAPVLAAMTSFAAARCLGALSASVAATLCSALPWSDAAALLRHQPAATREAMLAKLPDPLARRFRRSLQYAESTVGAWAELDAPALPANRSVDDALRLLARGPEIDATHILLTDDARRFAGLLPLAALLRAGSASTLGTLKLSDCRALRDSASIASVAASHDWEMTSLLPVVNYRGELLGGLGRRTLQKALSAANPAPPRAHSVFGQLLQAYLVAGEGTLRMLWDGAANGRRKRGEQG